MLIVAAVVLVLALVLGAQLLRLGNPTGWVKRAARPVRGGAGTVSAGARRVPGAVRGRATSLRELLVRLRHDPRAARWVFVAAIVVGGVLRLLWVIWATRQPTEFRDPAEYIRIAIGFGHGHLPRFGDVRRSDYWPPGYPALLAPFVWIGQKTGWASPAFVASLVNTVAGTVTIALTGLLAGRWFGRRARLVAAWLVALCPALIYWTSTAHSETAFTPFFLGAILLATVLVDRDDRAWRAWVLLGLLVGFAFLIRSPGVIGFAVPALALRARRGTWRGAARVTGLVIAGSAVLLVPWTVVNGVQLGLWTPASTNNASAACFGHAEDAPPLFEPGRISQELQVHCYRRSPFDDQRLLPMYEALGQGPPPELELGPPDEPRWYREAMGSAVSFAVHHPDEEVWLSVRKVGATWGTEGKVVDGARNYAEPGWAGGWQGALGAAANGWLWIVGTLALLGMALVPACRRALPIWTPIVLYTLAIVGGVAEPHYRYPVSPLLAILAAAFLTRPPPREGTAAAAVEHRARRLFAWLWHADRRGFVLAVVAAVGLRLAWVLWVGTADPIELHSDIGRNLEMARQFSHLETYRLYGRVTAFNAPGYSFLLTPFALVSRLTGWFEMPMAAALVNVAAGGATAALGGVLAGQWFGRRARTAAAWILAVAAGPIFLTVVALTETVFTALVLAVLVLVSRFLLDPATIRRPVVVGLGALIAACALVRPPGVLLLLVAIVALRMARGGWRPAGRAVVGLVGVVFIVLVPWAVRNGVQVGLWTPFSTNSAAFVCQGHGIHAKADVADMTYDDFAYCFLDSPFDPRDREESEWAPRIARRAVGWAVTHPVEELELTWDKTYATMVNDHQTLSDAEDGGRRKFTSEETRQRLDRLGELWHRAVLVLGLLALVVLKRARRAWPLWVTGAAFVAVVWGGNALDRYHHPTMAILAVFAGALLATVHPTRWWASARMVGSRSGTD